MTTLEKIKTIADHIRKRYGQEVAHRYEHAVGQYIFADKDWDKASSEPYKAMWEKTKELIDSRESLDESRLYVSDVVDMDDIQQGKLNLVYAPCGSGKTFFVENTLMNRFKNPKQNLLYLAPTISLVEAQKRRGKEIEIPYGNGHYAKAWRYPGITAMTYAAFGAMMNGKRNDGTYRDAECWNDHSVICADELSQGITQSNFDNNSSINVTRIALKELKTRIENKSNTVITISATPQKLINEYAWDIRVIGMFLIPDGYKEKTIKHYYDLNNLLNSIDPHKRGLIYAPHVTQMEDAIKTLDARGIHTECIFSKKSEKHTLTDRQHTIINTLIEEEKIPDDIQVLLINAAYETGLNIRPEKSHLDFIVVHSSDPNVQIQARGRYRGDLDILYCRSKALTYEIPDEIIAPYLDRWLDSEERDELIYNLGFKDERGRKMSWKKFCKILEDNGYGNDDTRDSSHRYWKVIRP